jgi:hypothetical protein
MSDENGGNDSFGGDTFGGGGGDFGGGQFGSAGGGNSIEGESGGTNGSQSGGGDIGNGGPGNGGFGLGGFSAADPAQTTLADLAILGQVAGAGLAGAVGKMSGAAISMAITGTAAYGSSIDAAAAHAAHDIAISMGFGGQAMLGSLN